MVERKLRTLRLASSKAQSSVPDAHERSIGYIAYDINGFVQTICVGEGNA
jgi:hypothetical protein